MTVYRSTLNNLDLTELKASTELIRQVFDQIFENLTSDQVAAFNYIDDLLLDLINNATDPTS